MIRRLLERFRKRKRIRIRGFWLRDPVGEMADPVGDQFEGTLSLLAEVSGEMSVEEVPLGIPQEQYAELLEGNDDKPREIVVEIAPGKSARGWNYLPTVFRKIVGEVMKGGLPGYKGHMKPEEVEYKFVDPVTHWIGAAEKNGRFYFRGVIDKAAGEIKSWLRSGRVTQVSIFGFPKLARAAGEIQVVDYQPISIDWTPLKRAGMPTRVAAYGEMDTILKPGEKEPEKDPVKPKGGGVETLQEWLAKGRELNVTPDQAIGELKWGADDVAKAAELEIKTESDRKILEAVGEMATKLGIEADDKGTLDLAKLGERVDALVKADESQRTAEKDKLVGKVVGEMVASEKGKGIVLNHRKLADLGDAPTEDEIKKAVGEILSDESVKDALRGLGWTQPIDPQNGSANGDKDGLPAGVSRRRVAI